MTGTGTYDPERTAQGLSFQKGGDDRHSFDKMDRPAFETWLRELATTDARLHALDVTPELVETCWGEYQGGIRL